MTCSVAGVLGALGDRWGILIVRDLLLGLSRYDDLKQSTGITNATLSDRLKSLEESALIERQRYQSKPDRYEYVLTDKGKDVALVIVALAQVGDKWNLDGLDGPPLKFVHVASGRSVKLAPVDAESGDPVRSQDIHIEAGAGADPLMKWRLEKGAPARFDMAARPIRKR
jgi:DNA-binding HxlR family transcriptional regulator